MGFLKASIHVSVGKATSFASMDMTVVSHKDNLKKIIDSGVKQKRAAWTFVTQVLIAQYFYMPPGGLSDAEPGFSHQ